MDEYWKKKSWKNEAQEFLPYMATPTDVIELIFKFLICFNYLKLLNLCMKKIKRIS